MGAPAQTIVTPARLVIAAAGTAQKLLSTAITSDNVSIQADPGNAGNIYVGDSNVSSATPRGWVLVPGQFFSLEGSRRESGSDAFDLSSIWVDASVSGDKVNFGYFKR